MIYQLSTSLRHVVALLLRTVAMVIPHTSHVVTYLPVWRGLVPASSDDSVYPLWNTLGRGQPSSSACGNTVYILRIRRVLYLSLYI